MFRGNNRFIRRAVCEQHKYGSVRAAPGDGGSYSGAPSMGADLEVKVLRKAGRSDPREGQGFTREGAAGGSLERSSERTNRNPISGGETRGERARFREAPTTKGSNRRSVPLCCEGQRSYLGRSRLASERATPDTRRSEKSAEAESRGEAG